MDIQVDVKGRVLKLPLNNTNIKKLLDPCSIYRIRKHFFYLVTSTFDRYICRQLLHVNSKKETLYTIESNQIHVFNLENFDDTLNYLIDEQIIDPNPIPKSENRFYNVLYSWSLGSSKLENSILSLRNIPKKFTSVSSPFLYRGIKLSPNAIKKILKGQSVQLKPRKVTSWTTSEKIARHFATNSNTLHGCVIKVSTKSVHVILNLQRAMGEDRVFTEKEVLVSGNGLDVISEDNICYRNFLNEEEEHKRNATCFYVIKSSVKLFPYLCENRSFYSLLKLTDYKKFLELPVYTTTHNRKIVFDENDGKYNSPYTFSTFAVNEKDSSCIDIKDLVRLQIRSLPHLLMVLDGDNLIDLCDANKATAIKLSVEPFHLLDTRKSNISYFAQKLLTVPQEYKHCQFNPVFVKITNISKKNMEKLSNAKTIRVSSKIIYEGFKSLNDAKYEPLYSAIKNNDFIIVKLDNKEGYFDVMLNPSVAFPENSLLKNRVFLRLIKSIPIDKIVYRT